jgi:hypothetical protein
VYTKRALKREPEGVLQCMYLDCECGHHLSIPVVAGMPMTYVCLCGIAYDSRRWIVARPESK